MRLEKGLPGHKRVLKLIVDNYNCELAFWTVVSLEIDLGY
jgi:hypothetical protein